MTGRESGISRRFHDGLTGDHMAEGVDSSYDPPTAAEVKAAGRVFHIRYVSTPDHAKNLTSAEVTAHNKAGVALVLVGEISAGRALGGRAQGKADMTSFQSQAKALGAPSPCVIYMAVDFDATSSQMSKVLDYIRGGADVVGEKWTGVYGSYDVIEAAAIGAVCDYFWQTYAWSGGKVSKHNHLYQYRNGVSMGSGTVDYDRSSATDYGQWGAQETDWWVD
jgi:hypothetical protein